MSQRLPLAFILITVMLDTIGLGLIIPVMPDLIREVDGGGLAVAAVWGGVLTTVFAVMQFLFAPIMGSLSDRYGRRPILLATLFVISIDYLVMALAGTIWLLFVGRVVAGVMAATQSTATAYIADISKPEEKAARFGLIGAAFGIGFVLGPLIGGLVAQFGTRAPFYVAAVLSAANFVFGYFVIRETVTDSTRRAFSWARANPFGAFQQVNALPGLGRLIAVFFFYQVAFWVYPSVWAYYTAERFDWSPGMIGFSLFLFGISLAAVQGGLIRPMLRVLGERGAVVYGHLADIAVFIIIGFVWSGTALLILTPLAALPAVITPALQGIMSKAGDDNQQGELQGALTSVSALAMIISPMLMTYVFYSFTGPEAPVYMPGASFYLSAVLMAVCPTKPATKPWRSVSIMCPLSRTPSAL